MWNPGINLANYDRPMPQALANCSHEHAWKLVDTSDTTPEAAAILARLLGLARSDWASPVAFDLADPVTERLLSKHRVSTLVPASSVPDQQRPEFKKRLLAIYGSQLRLESTATQILNVLADAGIENRVLKGLATAELDYPDRRLRQTGDIDIAIRFRQFDDALDILKRSGFNHHQTGNSAFLLKGETLDSTNGIELDIHTRLFQRSPETEAIFNDPGEQLADIPGVALCAEHRLVHAAAHFILAPPGTRRMSGLIDVTRLRNRTDLDLGKAREFAGALKVEPLTGAALRLEAQLAQRDDEALFANWCAPDWLDRQTRLGPNRNLVLDHVSRFREVPRRQWVRYLPTWFVPDKRLRNKFTASVKRKP